MPERGQRTWRWCRQYGDAAAAVVLTGSATGCLAAGGMMGSPVKVAISACLLGVTALVAWRRRHPVAVAIGAGAY